MRRRALPIIIGLLLAGLWGGGLGLLHLRGEIWFLDGVEATLVDLRTQVRGPVQPPPSVTLVAIDDETAKIEGSHPLRRSTLARLVDEIKRLGADAIALDLLLVDTGIEQDDKALAASLQAAPTVIAAAAIYAGGVQWMASPGDEPLSQLPNAERFLLPLGIFSDATAIGVVNVATDPTGTPRFVPLLFRAGERLETSLALRVAAIASKADPQFAPDSVFIGNRQIPTDMGYLVPLNFYGPRGTIATISAASVLSGLEPADSLRGRIVVVGSTVTGGGDVFPTPFDPVLPGAEVMATAISNLMAGDGLLRDHRVRLADAAISFLLPVFFVMLVAWRRSGIGLAAMAAVLAALVAVNFIAFANGIWLSAALPITAAAPPAILFGAAQLWLDRNRAQHFATQSKLLQQVQAPGLSDWLARHSDFLEEPVQMDTAVVFIDLSGFTGLSETAGPNVTRDVLNSFHALVDEEVTNCGGIVTSFLGDGAMILFGLPEPARVTRSKPQTAASDLPTAPGPGWRLSRPPSRRGWVSRSARTTARSWRPGLGAWATSTSRQPAIRSTSPTA